MKNTKKFDPKLCISFLIGTAVYFTVAMLLAAHKADCTPDTAIGVSGLKQVRQFLGAELAEEFGSAGAMVLGAFAGSSVYKLGRRDRSEDKLFFSPAAMIVAAFFAVMMLLTQPVKNRWDIQTELNGYSGLRIMKLTSLYIDCGRDLKEQSARELTGDGFTVDFHDNSYSRRSRYSRGRVSVPEYALEKNGKTVAQVAKKDQLELKDKLWKNNEHTVRLYEHSGLICDLDGRSEDFADDYTSMFTLTYEHEYLVRNTRPDEGELKDLYLVDKKGDEVIGQINMKNNTEFYMSYMTDLNFGEGMPNLVPVDRSGRIVYLEAFIDGECRRVSNIVKLGLGGIIEE